MTRSLSIALLAFLLVSLSLSAQKPQRPSVFDRTHQLKEVSVEVSSPKRRLETQGFAVHVIEPKQWASQSIQTVDLLERVAGVKVRQEGGLGSRTHYSINGLSGSAIKVFIDGVPAANYGSTFSLSSIPPALIERIEVYKGVLPSHLSDDALGGAINVVLRKQRGNSLAASYSFGSFGTHQAHLNGSLRRLNGFTAEVALFHNYSDNNYKVYGAEVQRKDYTGRTWQAERPMPRFHDAYRSTGARMGVGVTQKSWADRLMLTATLSDDYKEVQNGITMHLVYGDRHTRRRAHVLGINYLKENLFTPGLSLSMDASLSFLHRQVIDTVGIMYDWAGPISDGAGGYMHHNSGAEVGSYKTLGSNDERTLMLRGQIAYKMGRLGTLSLHHLFNDFRRASNDPLQPELLRLFTDTRDLRKNVFSLSHEHLSLGGRLRTHLFYKHYFQTVVAHEPRLESGKVEMYDVVQSIHHSGYGATAAYALGPRLMLLASGEQALRLPNANELFGNLAENLLPPSPLLAPERSLNLNVGLQRSWDFGERHHLALHGSLYYRHVRGMIREAIMTGSYTYSRFENLESVLGRGFDLEVLYDYDHRFHLRFALSRMATLFNTRYDKEGHPYLYYGMQIRNEPALKWNVQSSYRLRNLLRYGDRATLHGSFGYVASFHRNWSNVGSNNLPMIPAQYALDLGTSYMLSGGRVTLSLDVKNLLDRRAYDNFGLQKPGRALYAKVSYIII